MSIPLDRLYKFLQDICNRDDLIIYRFFPDGSRKITDLSPLDLPSRTVPNWTMICHDQEPLDPECFGQLQQAQEFVAKLNQHFPHMHLYSQQNLLEFYHKLNLRMPAHMPTFQNPILTLKTMLLVHSEQRSSCLEWYEQNLAMAGVYYWSHAIIARDWFRFAEHDTSLTSKNIVKDFLVYNRAWSGSREYRLRFAELLVNLGVAPMCVMGFNVQDSVHYTCHKFKNPELQISRQDLQDYFFHNETKSTASADYVSEDYQTTGIEVVLETLFDDTRLHLTEKSLRPIACGQPFMLAATEGSLEYLRSYGFETFAPWIDEAYDSIKNPAERLSAIAHEMQRISGLPAVEKTNLYNQLQNIALRNKELFFSDAWHSRVVNEFVTNFEQALTKDHTIKINIR